MFKQVLMSEEGLNLPPKEHQGLIFSRIIKRKKLQFINRMINSPILQTILEDSLDN